MVLVWIGLGSAASGMTYEVDDCSVLSLEFERTGTFRASSDTTREH